MMNPWSKQKENYYYEEGNLIDEEFIARTKNVKNGRVPLNATNPGYPVPPSILKEAHIDKLIQETEQSDDEIPHNLAPYIDSTTPYTIPVVNIHDFESFPNNLAHCLPDDLATRMHPFVLSRLEQTEEDVCKQVLDTLISRNSAKQVLKDVFNLGSSINKHDSTNSFNPGNLLQMISNIQKLEEGISQFSWNEKFQELLELPDTLDKFRMIRDLAGDFCITSQMYGRIIISERYLGLRKKTIKPTPALGGYAGGEKYVHKGILFKFAVDVQLPNGIWMYGGDKPSDEKAMKAAGHELKSLIEFSTISNRYGICYPLINLVDHRGFRVIAASLLPIDKSTILYGSDNGGKTVHGNPEIGTKMANIARELNLVIRESKGFVCAGPADTEVHQGRDGRLYIVDLARLFPPEAPNTKQFLIGSLAPDGMRRTIFYNLLRPQFVRSWQEPLCSDALSGWLSSHPKQAEYNSDVRAASTNLITTKVPEFAKVADKWNIVNTSGMKDQRVVVTVLAQEVENRVLEIHDEGINLRYLGLLYSLLSNTKVKWRIFCEMASRVIKNMFRSRLRHHMREIGYVGEEPYKNDVLEVLNLVLGGHNPKSVEFWTSFNPEVLPQIPSLKYAIIAKFGNECLTETQLNSNYDLRYSVGDLRVLVVRTCKITGIRLTESAMEELCIRPNSFELVYPDLDALGTIVKHMGIVELASAYVLFMSALEASKKDTDANEVDRLLDWAVRCLRQAREAGVTQESMEKLFLPFKDLLQLKHKSLKMFIDGQADHM